MHVLCFATGKKRKIAMDEIKKSQKIVEYVEKE
jgi:hypothetical protein